MKLPLLACLLALPTPAFAQHEGHGAPPATDAPEEPAADEAAATEPPHAVAMTGALGPYATTREASGTAWQPETSPQPHLRLGAGGLWAFNFVPAGLEPSYGGDPDGAMLFLRVTID